MKIRCVKVELSDGSSCIVRVEFHALTSVLMERIRAAVKESGLKRKVTNWDFVESN